MQCHNLPFSSYFCQSSSFSFRVHITSYILVFVYLVMIGLLRNYKLREHLGFDSQLLIVPDTRVSGLVSEPKEDSCEILQFSKMWAVKIIPLYF